MHNECLSIIVLEIVEAKEKKGKVVNHKNEKIVRLVMIATKDIQVLKVLNEVADIIDAGGDVEDEIDSLIGYFITQAVSHLEEEVFILRAFVACHSLTTAPK